MTKLVLKEKQNGFLSNHWLILWSFGFEFIFKSNNTIRKIN